MTGSLFRNSHRRRSALAQDARATAIEYALIGTVLFVITAGAFDMIGINLTKLIVDIAVAVF